jgi:hypothetical protein
MSPKSPVIKIGNYEIFKKFNLHKHVRHTITALTLSGNKLATKVAPAVENADAPTAPNPMRVILL